MADQEMPQLSEESKRELATILAEFFQKTISPEAFRVIEVNINFNSSELQSGEGQESSMIEKKQISLMQCKCSPCGTEKPPTDPCPPGLCWNCS